MAASEVQTASIDVLLAEEIGSCYADPYRFVMLAFPWGEPGPLEQYAGPDAWQTEVLQLIGEEVQKRRFDGKNPVAPIRLAISSGHGIGKSTLVAWLVCWILSTRKGCQGSVTANTFTQLEGKTWAAIQKWAKLAINSHWFSVGGERIYRLGSRESWFVQAVTCREENSEAFAGQHAASSTSFYIFDEASAVPDSIWEVSEGGLTDGEPMIFAFGNPTRSNGKFFRACFGNERNRWLTRTIDSRSSAITNKTQIAQWIEDYGEDSDFVRVRVRGVPPRASDLQFIDSERVHEAQKRPVLTLDDDPLIAGVDVARGGADRSVIWFRRGMDARSIRAIRISGEETRDSSRLVSKLAEVLSDRRPERKVTIMFIDATGIGGPIVDRLNQLGHKNAIEIQFGWRAPDPKYANQRSYMWGKVRDWLINGAIPDDPQLEIDLTGPGYRHDSHDKLVLESKEDMKRRGLDSPDDGDALALTFAQPVGPVKQKKQHRDIVNYYEDRYWESSRPAGPWI